MKSYTDIEQSKKLAEILPLESADNYYSWHDERYYIVNEDCPYPYSLKEKIPCWSLAALLEIIKKCIGYSLQSLDTHTVFMNCELGGKPYNIVTGIYDNPIDACYEMILKLHELNLL